MMSSSAGWAAAGTAGIPSPPGHAGTCCRSEIPTASGMAECRGRRRPRGTGSPARSCSRSTSSECRPECRSRSLRIRIAPSLSATSSTHFFVRRGLDAGLGEVLTDVESLGAEPLPGRLDDRHSIVVDRGVPRPAAASRRALGSERAHCLRHTWRGPLAHLMSNAHVRQREIFANAQAKGWV